MKTANFIYQTKSKRIYGKVTLKDNGKVSVSLIDAKYGTSMNDRYQAKNLGLAIAKADFKHEAATNVIEQNSSTGLIAELTSLTQDFKAKFIVRVKETAKRYFEFASTKITQSMEKWCEEFRVDFEYTTKNSINGQQRLSIKNYDKKYYKMRRVIEGMEDMVKAGYEKYESKEVLMAERHYTDGIAKLAYRLNQKGIVDGSEFKITSIEVGVNLEITITHGTQVTKAWTIVAEGEIQRAHYRYLVK